jgi:hypothetical protein
LLTFLARFTSNKELRRCLLRNPRIVKIPRLPVYVYKDIANGKSRNKDDDSCSDDSSEDSLKMEEEDNFEKIVNAKIENGDKNIFKIIRPESNDFAKAPLADPNNVKKALDTFYQFVQDAKVPVNIAVNVY